MPDSSANTNHPSGARTRIHKRGNGQTQLPDEGGSRGSPPHTKQTDAFIFGDKRQTSAMKSLPTLLVVTLSFSALAAEEAGFVPLFNGRDLTGWTNINCAPETWSVRAGVIHCTGKPTGALRTTRQYENFILETEWRHLESAGNSGVFIWGSPVSAPGVPFLRGIEVQVLDHGYATRFEQQTGKKSDWFTTHGDVFPIHGATMKPIGRSHGQRSFPSEDRSKPSPEWNHYRIVCTSGSLRLHVNGKEVSGGDECNYRKGYLALESEGAPVEFRNIRIKELPSTGAGPEVTAPPDPGWHPLFNGLDLRGWRSNDQLAARWHAGGRIALEDGAAGDATLWTGAEFGDVEFQFDCRPMKPTKGKQAATGAVLVRSRGGEGAEVKLAGVEPGKFGRFSIMTKGRAVTVKLNDQEIQRFTLPAGAPASGALGLADTGGAVEFMNLHWRDL